MTNFRRSYRAVVALTVGAGAPLAPGQMAPPDVLGKEYITEPNTNALGIPVTGQTVGWSGFGLATDSFVFGATELDGIANMGDGHFEGLIADTNSLILSLRTGGPASTDPFLGAPASLFYQNPTPAGGGTGVWATAPVLNPVAPPLQISGIELWGATGDTTHWSEVGDPGGVAVSTAAGPYLLDSEIEFAIGATEGIDIDALMILDHAFGTDLFHVGDYALMSVRANGQFDGGEIWLLERDLGGTLVASFFEHGGVTWDTTNDVSSLFGLPPGAEDVDALETVPVPAPGGWALGVMAVLIRGRRRRG